MAILVTGGAGYIGSVVSEALLEDGQEVIALDNLSHGYPDAVPAGARLERGDVGDAGRLDEIFRQYAIDGVIHMAAFIEVGESVREPTKYLENNFARPLTLLEAMRRHKVRDFVLSSTAAVYGLPDATPIAESAPTRPINPYGSSKLMLETALAWQARSQGLRYAALRYFNAAGATAASGERHVPESHLIPLVLETAAGERPQLAIFGDDYDTPDGTCIRDYIHVRDLAEAHLIALRRLRDAPDAAESTAREAGAPQLATRAYNLGNGRGFSVREVIDAAERVCGKKIPVRLAPRRPGDPARLVAASDKMLAAGWRPRHTDLEEIIASAWRWKRQHAPAAKSQVSS